MQTSDKHIYTVVGKNFETDDITTIYFSKDFAFKSGQFITVYFPDTKVAEGKTYSISSAPHEEHISVTVKDIGLFSHKLSTLRTGDSFTASSPYGFFYSEEEETTLVLLAAGIGVAPYHGIIIDSLKKNPNREIHLYYSVPRVSGIAFVETFLELAKEYKPKKFYPNISHHKYWIGPHPFFTCNGLKK